MEVGAGNTVEHKDAHWNLIEFWTVVGSSSHDRCPAEIQKEIQGIFGRGSREMRRDSEGVAGEIRHGSLSIKVLHAYVN